MVRDARRCRATHHEGSDVIMRSIAKRCVSKDEATVLENTLGRRLHPVMADAPFAAVGVAEQASGGEEEPAPAPHPQARVVAIHVAENGFDRIAVGIEIAEPVQRGALIIRAAPTPFLLDLE